MVPTSPSEKTGRTVFNLEMLVVPKVLHCREAAFSRAGTGHIVWPAFSANVLGAVHRACEFLEREQIVPTLGPVDGVFDVLIVMDGLASVE